MRMIPALYTVVFFLTVMIMACIPEKVKHDYITTIHPFQQILQPLLGEYAHISKIVPPGASPHTFSLKPSDLKLTESALALFVGHEHLDRWAYEIPGVERIELMSFIPAKFLKYFDHGQDDLDPHFWTDPLVIRSMLPGLAEKLVKLQPKDSVHFYQNLNEFMTVLDQLDLEVEQRLAPVSGAAVVLSHPSFRYYLLRYNFQIVDIIEPHPGSDPTPRAIQEKIELYKRQSVRLIITQVAHSDQTARLISEATGIPLVRIDPLGGTKGELTYREIILSATDKIAEALR